MQQRFYKKCKIEIRQIWDELKTKKPIQLSKKHSLWKFFGKKIYIFVQNFALEYVNKTHSVMNDILLFFLNQCMLVHSYTLQISINIILVEMISLSKLLLLLTISLYVGCTLFSVSAEFKVTYQVTHNQLAHIYYEQKLNEQGTNYIHVFANPEKSLLEQHRGAGFLEGYTTYRQIYSAYTNLNKFKINAATAKPSLQNFLTNQIDFIEQMVQNFPRDLYWQTVYAYLEQCRYAYRGYLHRLHEQSRLDLYIGFSQFYYLTSVGDFRELLNAYNGEEIDTREKDCSVYVRRQGKDFVVAHSTMNYYAYMLRIFKTYNFPTRNPNVGSQTITFSGRPGDFNSKDDFYLLSSGLKITQTSLLNYNKDNFKELNHNTVPCWLRAIVASNLARNGQEWMDYFSKYNSGTHSSQWVIVDPSQTDTNAVVFLEQAFSLIKIHDMTDRLNKNGFVASYNVAYDQEVYRKLGYEQYPYSFQNDPRATIFKNYHPKMKTIQDMKYWMLMNEQDDVRQGIAPREDYYTPDPQAFGIIDCKILTPDTQSSNYYWLISSPSTSDGRFAPFSWTAFPNISHEGMPNTYNFQWQKVPINYQKGITANHLMTQ